ncbi:hypothetical protein QTH97_22070 [Variovorax sp. J22R24]|uniref:hypothetical protein n=1 Tax=Variovorax gracilis TaxID=3053502 RepID=UPI002577C202|nr:hypothetical protein [Variovorax sp. J22R24]MDM0107651.1 hypothetical protein [Variovorax sp. J22R24]
MFTEAASRSVTNEDVKQASPFARVDLRPLTWPSEWSAQRILASLSQAVSWIVVAGSVMFLIFTLVVPVSRANFYAGPVGADFATFLVLAAALSVISGALLWIAKLSGSSAGPVLHARRAWSVALMVFVGVVIAASAAVAVRIG